MAIGYLTTNTLIEAAKRKASIPTNQETFQTEDFLSFANEELDIGLIPLILSLHEEYYVYPIDIPLVANKSKYPIPYRAVGGKLRDVFYKDSNGSLVEMTRINPEDKAMFQTAGLNSGLYMFYLEGNDVVLLPEITDQATGSLHVTIYLRPNDLVAEDRVAVITQITVASGTTTFTVDGIPTGFSTTTPFDILQAKSGHKTRCFDVTSTSISTTNKTVAFDTDDIASDIEVGDHIAFAGECIIPQCPSDLHHILAQRIAARCLEALGDREGLTAANTKLAEMEIKSTTLIDNRSEGAPQKIVNNRGLLNSRRRRRW